MLRHSELDLHVADPTKQTRKSVEVTDDSLPYISVKECAVWIFYRLLFALVEILCVTADHTQRLGKNLGRSDMTTAFVSPLPSDFESRFPLPVDFLSPLLSVSE